MPDPTPASALARMAEEATPEVVRTALELFHACAHKGEMGRCGRLKPAHPQKDHASWEPAFDAVETIRLIEMLAGLSRHEGQRDRELGLDKAIPAVVVPVWGLTADAAKRMSAEELDDWLLRRMGGEVLDAEVVGSGAGVLGLLGGGAGVGEADSEGAGAAVPERAVVADAPARRVRRKGGGGKVSDGGAS